MLYAGIDIGSLTAEAVIIDEEKIVDFERMSALPNPVESAGEVMRRIVGRNGIRFEDIVNTLSTGYGREKVQGEGMARDNVSEISCHACGAHSLAPEVRTVIDIGGQDAKAIRIDAEGRLVRFAMNDKCAAGTGQFLEVMSRVLGVTLDKLGPMSRQSRKPVEMTNRCSIYVETEVIHYLQRGVPGPDIAAGINRAMAARVRALVRRVGLEKQAMMTGGVAKNIAVRMELEKMLGLRVVKPEIDPQIIGAYGAAVLARRKAVTG